MGRDLQKEDLYESVKALVDLEDTKCIHLNQHKLFTLFSIAFQYLLFSSTKKPGAYVLRIEDSALAEKLARKCKDASTRKFMQSLLIPRKLKYNKSMFYLDFFHLSSWNLTNEVPKERLKGALIVKNTSSKPMQEMGFDETGETEDLNASMGLPEDYYLTSLKDLVPKTIFISFDDVQDDFTQVEFPFIKKDQEKTISGVTLGKDMDWEKID